MSDSISALREMQIGRVLLYSASDDYEDREWGGRAYRFPPKGTCEIHDHLDHPWNKARTQKLIKKAPILDQRNSDAVDAKTVAIQLLEKYEDRGLVMLHGDGEDERRMQEARRRYLEWRVAKARQKQQSFLNACKAAEKANALPPVQSPEVRREIEFLERHEAGLVDRKRYISRIDSFEADNLQEVLEHNRKKYPNEVNAKGEDGCYIDLWEGQASRPVAEVPPVQEPEPEPVAAPGPRTLDLKEASEILAGAHEFGVALEASEIHAILTGDREVTQDVVGRLTKAYQAAQATPQTSSTGRRKAEAQGRRSTRRRTPKKRKARAA